MTTPSSTVSAAWPAGVLGWLRANNALGGAELAPEALESALARTLGERYTGFGRMAPHRQALARSLASHARRQAGDADTARLEDAASGILRQHAFESTGLVTLLLWARAEGGPLPPVRFRHLKALDPDLWHALDGVGQPGVRPEALGVLAHHAAERAVGHPLEAPFLEPAVEAVEGFVERHLPR